jgi:hypothetical protein
MQEPAIPSVRGISAFTNVYQAGKINLFREIVGADSTPAAARTRDGRSYMAADTPIGSDNPHVRRAKRGDDNRHDSPCYSGDYRDPNCDRDASRARDASRDRCFHGRVAAIGNHYVRRALV